MYPAYTCTMHTPHKPFMHTQSHTPGTNIQIVHTMIHTDNECMCTLCTHISYVLSIKESPWTHVHTAYIYYIHISHAHCMQHNVYTHRSKEQAHIKKHFYNLPFQFNNMLRKHRDNDNRFTSLFLNG